MRCQFCLKQRVSFDDPELYVSYWPISSLRDCACIFVQFKSAKTTARGFLGDVLLLLLLSAFILFLLSEVSFNQSFWLFARMHAFL